MAESTRELVVLMTHGADHELSSVAFTIANGGMTAGFALSEGDADHGNNHCL